MVNAEESDFNIVIDIGGTNFRCSIIDYKNQLDESTIVRSQSPSFNKHPKESISELQERLIDEILQVVFFYKNKYTKIKTVGISFPGPITKSGIIIQAPTLWGDEGRNFDLLGKLRKKNPTLNWMIANDVSAAAERYGSLKEYHKYDFLGIITISSGVGIKIFDVKNKRVILDNYGLGGELGHVRINYSRTAEKCDCGELGHIGAYSSGRAIERQTIKIALVEPIRYSQSSLSKIYKHPELITNQGIIMAIKDYDDLLNQILDDATFPVAQAISYYALGIGIKKFVLIGGFAVNCGDFYQRSLIKNLKKISIHNLNNRELENMVDIGFNDDNDSLIGMGVLINKIM